MMRKITLTNTAVKDFHQFMLGGITPRPIALVSTVDNNGIPNLAPYSYFNAVSSVPPILMVSIGRKTDGSKKDTLINIECNGEFVVNMVHYPMIRQMALTSVQIPSEEDEFKLAGLEQQESTEVKPARVKSAPIHFECSVNRIIEIGTPGNLCNLVFGDVQCIHIDEEIIDERNRIDPAKLEIVGRLGRSYYTKTGEFSLETVVQPQLKRPIGFGKLPTGIVNSEVLRANDLAKLASLYTLPSLSEVEIACKKFVSENPAYSAKDLHETIRSLIQQDRAIMALKLAIGLS